MTLTWDDKFSINHSIIDEHRQNVLKKINDFNTLNLQTVSKEEYKKLVGSLYQAIVKAFKEEDGYMESIEFPYLDQHLSEHRFLLEHFQETLVLYKTRKSIHSSLLLLCKSRIAHHIISKDQAILEWQKEYSTRSRQKDDDSFFSIA